MPIQSCTAASSSNKNPFPFRCLTTSFLIRSSALTKKGGCFFTITCCQLECQHRCTAWPMKCWSVLSTNTCTNILWTLKMFVGLCVCLCVCARMCVCECAHVCEAEVSGLSLLKSTSMLKTHWVMTQGFLKSVSIQHVACKNSWISYNKHLFVSILCVVRPIQSVLSFVPLSHLMVQLSVTVYQATFNCLCLFLSHWHNPVWCIFQGVEC